MQWHGSGADTNGNISQDAGHSSGNQAAFSHSAKPRANKPGSAFARLTRISAEQWRSKILREKCKPEGPQLAYLDAVIKRCVEQAHEERQVRPQRRQNSEPKRCCLLGIPGAGKTECVKWQIRFFKECLGWQHGVQFQCLASQHTMAALFGGTTVHGWGQVPIDPSKAHAFAGKKHGTSAVDELFKRAQSIEWLIIDEISTLAVLVAGVFDGNLRRARKRHEAAKRPDGSERPFGGINVTFAGDW